jgi:hypothetical protein
MFPVLSPSSFDQQARQDFEQATLRAFIRQIISRLLRRDNNLLSFDHIRHCLKFGGQHERGLQVVKLDHIVGSVGRYLEFDRRFLPRRERNETVGRWVNIAKAYYQQVSLPPVDLFKVGDAYFVKDGNHRISVARVQGQEYIEAQVVEIDTDTPLTCVTMFSETCGCP